MLETANKDNLNEDIVLTNLKAADKQPQGSP